MPFIKHTLPAHYLTLEEWRPEEKDPATCSDMAEIIVSSDMAADQFITIDRETSKVLVEHLCRIYQLGEVK